MGLVHTIAKTRERLAVSLAAALAPWLLMSILATSYIRESSTSAGVDMILITLWMLLSFLVAVLGGLLIADVVFAPGWREVNLLGERVDATDLDTDVAKLGAATRPQTLPLAGIITGVIALLVVGSTLVTDDFFGWYSRYGYATSTLRGDDDALKVAVLEEMTRAQDDRLIQFTTMMEAQLEEGAATGAVRVQAVYSLGEVGRRMLRSIELMDQGTKGGEWVKSLNLRLVEEVQPKLLMALAAKPSQEMRHALIFALGAMRSMQAVEPLREALSDPARTAETVEVVIRALARYRTPDRTVELLLPVLAGEDAELAGLAVWAIGDMYGLGTGEASEALPNPALIQLIAQRLPTMPFETQCMVVDAMLRIRAEQLDNVLFGVWDAADPVDKRCPRRVLERRFEGPLAISKEEEMREKVVKALAAIAQGNSRVMTWMSRKSKDERVASGLRNDMRYILDVLAGRKSAP